MHPEPTGKVAEGLKPDRETFPRLHPVEIIHEGEELAPGHGGEETQDAQFRQDVQEEPKLEALAWAPVWTADTGKGS